MCHVSISVFRSPSSPSFLFCLIFFEVNLQLVFAYGFLLLLHCLLQPYYSLYCQLLTKLCCCVVLSVRSKPGVKNVIIHIFFSFLQSLLQTRPPIKWRHGFQHLMLEVFFYLWVTKNISQLSHLCLFNPLKTALESKFIWWKQSWTSNFVIQHGVD